MVLFVFDFFFMENETWLGSTPFKETQQVRITSVFQFCSHHKNKINSIDVVLSVTVHAGKSAGAPMMSETWHVEPGLSRFQLFFILSQNCLFFAAQSFAILIWWQARQGKSNFWLFLPFSAATRMLVAIWPRMGRSVVVVVVVVWWWWWWLWDTFNLLQLVVELSPIKGQWRQPVNCRQ